MPNTKSSAFAVRTPAAGDLFLFVDDPGGAPLNARFAMSASVAALIAAADASAMRTVLGLGTAATSASTAFAAASHTHPASAITDFATAADARIAAATLAALSDVSQSSPTDGQALVYRGGAWANETISGGGGGGGVGTSGTPSSGQYARFTGAATIEGRSTAQVLSDIGAAAAAHTHTVSGISATGTPSGSTFLRGDGAWAAPVAAVAPRPGAPPLLSALTAVNPLAPNTIAQNSFGELIVSNSTGTTSQFTAWTLPITLGANFTFTIRAEAHAQNDTFWEAGITIRHSTGNHMNFGMNYTVGVGISRWASPTVFTAAGASMVLRGLFGFMQVKRVGTALTFSYGLDGETWITVGTATVGTDISNVDELGLFMHSNAVTTPGQLRVFGWSIT